MRETDKAVSIIEQAAVDIHNALSGIDYTPLDGDDVQIIVDLFTLNLNWLNGNITHKEYTEHCRLMFDQKEVKQ